MERRYRKEFKGVYYNGLIGGQTAAYLKANIAFGITLKTLDWNQDIEKLVPSLIPLMVMIAYPIACIIVLHMYRHRLDDPDIKAKISNMYVNISAKRSRYAIFAYPVWILRRLFFVLIPLILAKYPSLQIMFLAFSDILYITYYAGA